MTDEDVRAQMRERMYVHEHSPNCPSQHLVRLINPRKARIMWYNRRPDPQGDILGYGHTFEEAAREALMERQMVVEAIHREHVARRLSQAFGVPVSA